MTDDGSKYSEEDSGQEGEQPPAYEEQPPPEYGEQPPPEYGEQPPPGYGEQPPPGYGEQPPPGYGEQPPPGYGEQPPSGYGEQPPPGYGYPQQGYPPPPGYGPPPGYAPGYGVAPYGQYPYVDPNAKSKLAAGLLGIFLGGFGVHRFYLGYVGIGVVQIVVTLLTCGLGSLWGLIEGILYLVGSNGFTTDAEGRPLKE